MKLAAAWIVAFTFVACSTLPAHAQSSGAPPAGSSIAAVASDAHRDYVAEAHAGFTHENREYQRRRVALALVSPLVEVAFGLLLLFGGVAQRLRDFARAKFRGRWGRMLVFYACYSAIMFVVMLPLSWYEGYALERQFGLSNESLAHWGVDELKSLVFQVVAVGVVPLLAVAWHAVEASPRRWWLWLALGTLPVVTAGVLLQPLVFDPLFNKFTPLHEEVLRRDILALAARADIPAKHVYEVDMSARTRKINAYVSGFGASQRIVIWDTALKGLAHDEILFVMGHEMGHYALRHIWKGLACTALGAFAAFGLTAWFVRLWLRAFGERWGVRVPGDVAALPLLLAMLGLVNWLGLPITNAISRALEHEADVYSLELTHDNDAGARSFLALAAGNRSDPEPAAWVKLVLFTHPPLGDRIRFALAYRPWDQGRPNRVYRER